MKSFILLIVLFATCFFRAEAQVPNGDFEAWTSFGFYEEPNFWNTSDSVALALSFGTAHSATKETVDMHGGLYALKLFPFSSFATFPGVASNGRLNNSTLSFEGGTPDNVRHQTLNGWYKYAPVSNDSCTISVSLFKWNGATKVIIADGVFGTSVAASSYTPFSINLTYATTDTPDTMLIAVYSSALGAAHVGTVLLVDDFSFSGVVSGISDPPTAVNALSVFPVPAVNELHVRLDLKTNLHTSLEITDISGKQLIIHEMNAVGAEEKINIRKLSNGNYLYRLVDDTGNKLASGKFSVVR